MGVKEQVGFALMLGEYHVCSWLQFSIPSLLSIWYDRLPKPQLLSFIFFHSWSFQLLSSLKICCCRERPMCEKQNGRGQSRFSLLLCPLNGAGSPMWLNTIYLYESWDIMPYTSSKQLPCAVFWLDILHFDHFYYSTISNSIFWIPIIFLVLYFIKKANFSLLLSEFIAHVSSTAMTLTFVCLFWCTQLHPNNFI